MLAPEIEAAGHQATWEGLAGDVLLRKPGREERVDRIAHLAEH